MNRYGQILAISTAYSTPAKPTFHGTKSLFRTAVSVSADDSAAPAWRSSAPLIDAFASRSPDWIAIKAPAPLHADPVLTACVASATPPCPTPGQAG